MSLLEVKKIYKSFGKTEVLKGIDFSLEKGEVLSIIGSSGSGKTTLLRCITMLESAEKGEILVDGEYTFNAESEINLTEKEKREKQLNFGLVFQNFNLFPQYNVLDNVTLAMKNLAKEEPDFKKNKKERYSEIEQEAKKIIESVGLSSKLNAYPCELSGGQQQRVAIARALALKPKILFFDEPTSALDPELTGEVLKVIRELAKQNITMVIVTHEMSFAREVSDKVIFMDEGIVAAMGTPEEVFEKTDNERIKQFLSKVEDY